MMEENPHYRSDEAIRQKFGQFEPEPPASVWDKVRETITPPSSAPIVQFILPVITGLLFIIAFLLIQISIRPSDNIDSASGSGSADPGERSGTWFASVKGTNESPVNLDIQARITTVKEDPSPEPTLTSPGIPVRAPFSRTAHQDPSTISRATSGSENLNPGFSSRNIPKASKSDQERFAVPDRAPSRKAEDISTVQLFDKGLAEGNRPAYSNYDPDYFIRIRPVISIGLYISPEATFYPSTDLERGSCYSIGLLPAVQFSKFFIQSGLNLRTTRDEGNFQINYNQFLGQYEDVYLVTFDSTENGVIPTYHTQTVDVYDTIDHYVITQASARYSYLEVPVFFGIRKDYTRVSWFVKGGPSCAFIVGRNVPEASLPADQARILNVDRQIPVRTDVSWQFIAAAGIDFRFNRRMSFSLEPTFRYYLSPEISSGSYYSGKNPLSIGIRAGLIYNFND